MPIDLLPVAVALATLVGAVAQSVSGIGFILVGGPALVAALGPRQGVLLGIVLSLVVNAAVLGREWRSVRPSYAVLLFVPAALTTPLWAAALSGVDRSTGARAAGAAIVAGVLLLAVGLRWRAARGRGGAVLAAVVSSGMNVLAAVGGPAVAVYAANADWPPRTARATLQAYFLALNVVAVATLGLPTWRPAVHLPAAAGLAAGLAAGAWLAPHVSATAARRATLLLAGVGGALLLVAG